MLSVTDIPVEIFLDNLLPRLPLNDLLQLQSTNKFFATLCSDETFWKKKLSVDFNFPDESTARTSGWKFIYLRLVKPRVFVWGRKEQGRLGMTTFPQSTLNNVSFPLELKFPGSHIVNLAAAGMSFQALDSEGCIHVWGALDGSQHTLRRDGFSESGKKASTPMRLQLPTAIRSISCGRLHSSSLDFNNQIWTFLSWGRPFRLVSDLFNTPEFMPIQVECGWSFSSALTKSGDVMVWWPFSDPLRAIITTRMGEMDNQGGNFNAHSTDGVIMCTPWDLEANPIVLPSLPSLPKLFDAEADSDSAPQIIKIAGFDNAMVALTNQGHVLLFDNLSEASRGNWQYLPNFSEASRIRNHDAFSSANLEAPRADFKITHISAHFRTFIAYSESIVLMGNTETKHDTQPKIIPGLQNKSIISVVLGDYHFAAVTATGKLLTWGQYSDGALGLGDPGQLPAGAPGGFADESHRLHALETRRGTPVDVEIPTEVRFDHHRKKPKERFCVSAAASGWHTGALVIDLETNENEDDSDLDVDLQEETRTPIRMRQYFGTGGGRGQGETPPILPGGIPAQNPGFPFIGRGGGLFRIGFAGRGMHRGRGT
ncbi:regulator of chromosome condensation 1/beta-lactamase-inhibitor protein II [Lentinula aciculospora]|uniref:Regulator of chromosome condensation 1/beta-lactamase-inhibitor protein II n=1 Tax=Lentinula aciculospora TaxID=153920 RepID=A0A9W9DGL7_9AGAR|nr:regulator of chromosome condensation 1/beta-lactamase-inhibitor protein II [Lentinula aciculospora]